MKTPSANPRMSFFENCFKSCFDTARWWGMSSAFDFLRNYWFRCFLRWVMAISRQQKNFGPNVIYFVLRVDSWVSLPPHSSWRLQLRLRLFTAFVVNFFAAVTLYANVYKLSVSNHFQHRSNMNVTRKGNGERAGTASFATAWFVAGIATFHRWALRPYGF